MKSVLVLFAHPALDKSRINVAWLAAARRIEGVTVHDLYETYPDFDIDVAAEQALLTQHDAVVLQHPLYWYSTPALVKQWFDIVLEQGWAYGAGGTALVGKQFMNAISTGGPRHAYHQTGAHGATLWELLAPLRQTARLCSMEYLPPYVAHGALAMSQSEIDKSAHDYAVLLRALVDERLDLNLASSAECIELDFIAAQPRGIS